jgi:hypothetical protein
MSATNPTGSPRPPSTGDELMAVAEIAAVLKLNHLLMLACESSDTDWTTQSQASFGRRDAFLMPDFPIQYEPSTKTEAEALLREYPDALVCGLLSNGLIVPVPPSIELWGQKAIEGRAMTDIVVAEDRVAVLQGWA